MPQIFICYRHEASILPTRIVEERLASHFGREQVFGDQSDMPLGVDYRDWLDRQIRGCGLVLVVIGKEWLTVRDANGVRRLDAPTDYVRTDIEIALSRGIHLIPIQLEEVATPDEGQLPTSIGPLAYRQAATVHAAGAHFRAHMEHLIRGIDRLLGQPEPEREPAIGGAPLRATPAVTIDYRRAGLLVGDGTFLRLGAADLAFYGWLAARALACLGPGRIPGKDPERWTRSERGLYTGYCAESLLQRTTPGCARVSV